MLYDITIKEMKLYKKMCKSTIRKSGDQKGCVQIVGEGESLLRLTKII